jgi:nucleoside-diphosphate-sugar epimerase
MHHTTRSLNTVLSILDMSSTTVFLTGATGNVGQAVIPVLLHEGLGVTVLVRKPSDINGCRTSVGSLEHADRLAAEVQACDAIVHLACSQSQDPSEVLRQDIAGTAGLIDAWRKGPFVYASASTVYGPSAGALSEVTAVAPQHGYDFGKCVNEFQLRLAERRHGRGGAVLLRPGLIFAVNSRSRGRHLLGQVFTHCRHGGRFIFGSEEGLANYGCSFISGADFGRAIVKALTQDLSGVFNIAGAFCTWHELIETINRVAGTKADLAVRAGATPQPGEFRLSPFKRQLDASLFEKATGFKARETLEEIVEALVRMERTQQPA